MQTVNFQCGHCGKLMAVSIEFLGQQVRCPHCQQVVLAPTSAGPSPAPAPEPARYDDPFTRMTERSEDIFSTSETEDALFGAASAPRLEMPKEPSPAPAPAPEPASHSEPTLAVSPTASFPGADATLPVEPATSFTAATSPTPWMSEHHDGASTTDAEPAPVATESESVRRVRSEAGRINWFIPLVFIPLILYAVLATVAAGFLYLRVQTAQPSLFDQMPDIDGDVPGVRKGKSRAGLRFDRQTVTQPLPEHLRVRLGETLRIGDLEVTPKKVERKRVAVFVEGFDKSEPCANDSLVLSLHLRNLADDYAFTPVDNYFDRHWNGKAGPPPLTMLVAGSKTFFGGPAKWFPMNRSRKDRTSREWVEGRKNIDPEGLKPGQEGDTFVCTDGSNPETALVLFGENAEGRKVRPPYQGNLLWRVQVRRGLVNHKGRALPAAAVIGVLFSSKDYSS